MDGQEYLNQISASNRPTQQSSLSKLLTSKFFLIGVGALVALIIIIIIGSMLSSGKGDEKSECIALYLHINNTSGIINEYQDSVRSSSLRASSSSLNTVLQDTGSKMGDYLGQKYNLKSKDINKKLTEKANQETALLNEELYDAKINGFLDRTYAHKMDYEIQLFVAEANQIRNKTKEEALKGILETFNSSLENLYNEFNNFSEGQ